MKADIMSQAPAHFRLFVYDATSLEENAEATIDDIKTALSGKKRLWIEHAGALSELESCLMRGTNRYQYWGYHQEE